MLFLIITILLSTSLNIILRLFHKWNVDVFQSIVFNYWTCAIFGGITILFSPGVWQSSGNGEWLPIAISLGLVFIIGFNIAAATIKYFGVTLATIIQKVSLVFTVLVAILFFNESSGAWKIIGVGLAFPAIILLNINSRQKEVKFSSRTSSFLLLLLPLLTFLISGLIEVTFYYVKETDKLTDQDLLFTTVIFTVAALIGTLVLIAGVSRKKMKLEFKNLKAGIILGLPNFGSILFLMKALSSGMEGSVVIPLNNIAIVLLSALAGWFIFLERFRLIHYIGFGLAIASIVLISYPR